jgi:hypothetical protein
MALGVIFNVPMPVDMYDAVHAELLKQSGQAVDGLVLHVGRSTSDGFQVIEVWESREQFERYYEEVVDPIVDRISGGQAPPARAQISEEFDVRGLVIPHGDQAM